MILEENFRKHILSQYTSNFETRGQGKTMYTESVESSDADEFIMGSPTYLTHAIEESDPDEFLLMWCLEYIAIILMEHKFFFRGVVV